MLLKQVTINKGTKLGQICKNKNLGHFNITLKKVLKAFFFAAFISIKTNSTLATKDATIKAITSTGNFLIEVVIHNIYKLFENRKLYEKANITVTINGEFNLFPAVIAVATKCTPLKSFLTFNKIANLTITHPAMFAFNTPFTN